MDIVTFSGPTPGTALPGNLYADLQSRTLWLGVEAAVDPNQAVLISDILGLQTEIDGALAEAKAYTDSKILTRAPVSHTHTASQITDFASAVQVVVAGIPGFNWVTGMIMQYSGSLADIGVGQLAGWSLCDGSNGTPDLRDRFVVGAGNKVVGAKNTGGLTIDIGGGHDHAVNATALTLAQIPAHNHTGATTGRSADHQHFVNINSSGESADHNHSMPMYSRSDSGSPVNGSWALGGSNTSYGAQGTSGRNVAHYHNVQGWTGGESVDHGHGIYTEGSNQPHSHTIVGGGGLHQHAISVGQLREGVPYFALAYIMKL
jgi:hypothetical protein